MIKKAKLPTILGLIILLAGTFAGVFFLNMTQVFKIGASPENSPKDVRISNISDSGATISWITDAETSGFLVFGTSANNLDGVEIEDTSNSKYKTHSVNLSGIEPNTEIFFKINSNGTDYDNNSLPWKFTTGPELGFEEFSIPISGTVITASGTPVKRGIVYLNIGGYLVSTLTSNAGSYVFQLGDVRTQNLKGYLFVDENSVLENKVLEFSVQADSSNFASAQINLLSAEAVPPIIIGKSQDFRNSDQKTNTTDPNAILNLPQNNTQQNSKFQVPTATVAPAGATVILESIKDGEIISTEKPQFFGKGPSGSNLQITVHSDQLIQGQVSVPKTGSWNWTPPQNLSAGAHSITVSWVDTTGITRSLTRNFIVQAAEAPAFTASNSASTPSPTPKGTISPTPVATPTATIKGSPTPLASPTESPVPVPVTGELTPTIFLFIMSIGILVFSFGIWKISENA